MLFFVCLAIAVAFCVLVVWKWTAQFTWSSDAWLMAIPDVLMLCSVCSIIVLVILGCFRVTTFIKNRKANTENTLEQ